MVTKRIFTVNICKKKSIIILQKMLMYQNTEKIQNDMMVVWKYTYIYDIILFIVNLLLKLIAFLNL